jgi:hypothetical protein
MRCFSRSAMAMPPGGGVTAPVPHQHPGLFPQRLGQVVCRDRRALTPGGRPLEHRFQLPDLARPRIALEPPQGCLGDAHDLLASLPANALEEKW